MPQPLHDNNHYTYADYLQWPDEPRYELIDGQAYAMAPAPSTLHQTVLLEVSRQIADALDASGNGCDVFIAPFDVRLPLHDEADAEVSNVVQPDISVFCDPQRIDKRGARGAPDWVVEVLSPGNAAHDQIRKRDLYERSGVQEYWLVHPDDRLVMVYRLVDGEYGKPLVAELKDSLPAGVLPDVIIDWERVTRKLDR